MDTPVKPDFSMQKWIDAKKAKGQWTGTDTPDKSLHKPFDPSIAKKPLSSVPTKPFTPAPAKAATPNQ